MPLPGTSTRANGVRGGGCVKKTSVWRARALARRRILPSRPVLSTKSYNHKHEWQLLHPAVDDRATEPACRSDLKSNGTSETRAPELPRRDRSPKGRLSGPDRAPAGASAGFTNKNGEPQRRHTTALMARPPHGGLAHRGAAAKPLRAAKRTRADFGPAATAAPADVADAQRA